MDTVMEIIGRILIALVTMIIILAAMSLLFLLCYVALKHFGIRGGGFAIAFAAFVGFIVAIAIGG